jgi:hypothetical protein
MFRTKLLNSFSKIKEASKKIYQRIYNRTYEQLAFDADCGVYLGFIIGSGISSYTVIHHYMGDIYKTDRIITTIVVSIIGSLFGGSWGVLCGYLYPYGLVGLPSIILSYNAYHNYYKNNNNNKNKNKNNDNDTDNDKIKMREIVLDDLSLTQKFNK